MSLDPQGKLAYTITEAYQALGIGRTSLYGEIKTGQLESFKACGRTLIPADALIAYVERARRQRHRLLEIASSRGSVNGSPQPQRPAAANA